VLLQDRSARADRAAVEAPVDVKEPGDDATFAGVVRVEVDVRLGTRADELDAGC
jgi:hypothetical protein